MLFREALGEVLREQRTAKKKTLRDLSTSGFIALGYLSEVERGQKEASSEVIENLALALGLSTADLVMKTSMRLAGLDIPNTAEDLLKRVDEYADLISH
jgi:transcriptional regulator with XRE-family HTH domain